ncbi:MAG: gliding motility-associated C-terminal domain-containing protein [Sediminibacterium sp.]
MKKNIQTYKKIIQTACLIQVMLLSSFILNARNLTDTFALYIAPNGVLYVNPNAQLGIVSGVINAGMFGTVKGTTVQMAGDFWRNTPGASFPDEMGINNANAFTGVGGTFRFVNNNAQQYLSGGYSVTGKKGPSFPNLTLANGRGLFLYQQDALVKGTLHFETGLLSLNDNNLVMGINDPGTITGYTENRFVATGNTFKGGFLYRTNISGTSGSLVFPIGTQAGSYAPFSIMFNATTPESLHARVFDSRYNNGFFGTTGYPFSVQQTWNIGQETNTKVPTIMAIQHQVQREGAGFTAHRGDSYISLYDFSLKAWDTLGPSGILSPGTITTGQAVGGAYINTRSLDSVGTSTFFTKTADPKGDSVTLAKGGLTPIKQPDGSFLVTYIFLLQNAGRLPASSVQLLDTLDKVFPSPASFTVVSITTSGNLVANKNYDGVAVTDLLQSASTLSVGKIDTVTLVVNVMANQKEGYYYNNAYLRGVLTGFGGHQYTINNRSVNGFTSPNPSAQPVPTPMILTESKYQLPHGFSPNGDGVNDRFIIGNVGPTDQVSVLIFNRQGQMVYRNTNYHNEWDGTSNQGGATANKKIEDGTYFYRIAITEGATGKQENFYGFISIFK